MDYVKKAEKNVVKVAKELEEFMRVLDCLAHAGNKMFQREEEKTEYFAGLVKMRNATYKRYCEAISDCFTLAGVGGEDVQKYAKEKFIEHFNPAKNHSIMNFLDEYGNIPSWYKSDVAEEFRKQAEKIREK